MKINRRYAVISFCSDLTNPKGVSYPVAVIGVGESPKLGFLFCGVNLKAVETAGKRVGDELSQQMLRRLPEFLEAELSEGIKQAGPHNFDFVTWIHERLRNSLHVSFASEPSEANLDAAELLSWFQQAFRRRATKVATSKPSLPDVRFRPLSRESASSALAL